MRESIPGPANTSESFSGQDIRQDQTGYNNSGSVFGSARDLAIKKENLFIVVNSCVHYMKLLMGFIVLLVALVAVTGCTQTAASSSPATTATTVPPTTVVTTATTAVPTPNATAIPVNSTEENLTWEATPTPASMVTIIHLTSAGFTPVTDIVLPGTGVFFVNNDNVPHTIIGIGNSTGTFNSGVIIPGSAFSYTFGVKPGVLIYGLSDNPNVTGTIIVQPPSGVATYQSA